MYDNISIKVDFQGPGLKVKVIEATFGKQKTKKNSFIVLAPTFIGGF